MAGPTAGRKARDRHRRRGRVTACL